MENKEKTPQPQGQLQVASCSVKHTMLGTFMQAFFSSFQTNERYHKHSRFRRDWR